ncbi:hypothetical protein DMP17_38480 [Pseudonocardia sp. TMWB2A]|uniref:8-oxoguanine DNA glycosylase OGG fold protein n=1 Tax=Pseudonocardia sp. TMWB2A TaxID=687430 RepID=UPI00307F9123
MPDVPHLPPELRTLIERRGPLSSQQPIRWNRRSWLRRLDDLPEITVLRDDSLGDEVSREQVTDVFRAVGRTRTVTDAFVAAMVWGYGPVGYGPYRTRRVLTANQNAASRLHEVLSAAAVGDRKRAFDLARAPGLKYLGPAFGTKFLYYASLTAGRDSAVLPILDSVVAGWFQQNTTFQPRLDLWRWQDYEHYLHVLQTWSRELDGIRIDVLEQLIFDSAWSAGTASRQAEDLPSALLRVRELSVDLPDELRSQVEPHLDALDDLVGTGLPETTTSDEPARR